MAENRSLLQVKVEVLFLPIRESCTDMSMQEGSRVSHSPAEVSGGEGEGETWISMNAEPKLPRGREKRCEEMEKGGAEGEDNGGG